MSSGRDDRLKDFRGLRERVRRRPETFGAFLGELHRFLHSVYEAAARADGNDEGFAQALGTLYDRHGIEAWEDFVGSDHQRQFFKDGKDPEAHRIIAFWAELDEPLAF